jgi:hypothetical protein
MYLPAIGTAYYSYLIILCFQRWHHVHGIDKTRGAFVQRQTQSQDPFEESHLHTSSLKWFASGNPKSQCSISNAISSSAKYWLNLWMRYLAQGVANAMQNNDSILIVIETFLFDRLTGEHIIHNSGRYDDPWRWLQFCRCNCQSASNGAPTHIIPDFRATSTTHTTMSSRTYEAAFTKSIICSKWPGSSQPK